jgi:16S rRNA G1207 methylase RsmC
LVIPLKTKNRKENNMTTAELYAETLRNMSIVAEDESLMRRVAKYLRKVVAEKKADPTEMTKEEMCAKIEKAEYDYLHGDTYAMLPGENFSDFRKRIGR